jgi:hypothetical protein
VTKILKEKQRANSDFVNNLMKKWNTSQQHALERKQYIKRHDSVCAQLHFSIFKEIGVNLDNKHSHDLVCTKSVETRH